MMDMDKQGHHRKPPNCHCGLDPQSHDADCLQGIYIQQLKNALHMAQESYEKNKNQADFDVIQEYEKRLEEELEQLNPRCNPPLQGMKLSILLFRKDCHVCQDQQSRDG